MHFQTTDMLIWANT